MRNGFKKKKKKTAKRPSRRFGDFGFYAWGELSNLFIISFLAPPLPHLKSKRKKKRRPLGIDSCYKVFHTPNPPFLSDLVFLVLDFFFISLPDTVLQLALTLEFK